MSTIGTSLRLASECTKAERIIRARFSAETAAEEKKSSIVHSIEHSIAKCARSQLLEGERKESEMKAMAKLESKEFNLSRIFSLVIGIEHQRAALVRDAIQSARVVCMPCTSSSSVCP